ncbi:hypothetical protein VA596_43545 [Amycolatopsis sp., V23-08]|uniref:DUF3592 domain-containing protein n=1 Tax=Amycolatopsis heterodermiae TaxID=3110235 RepID=A0ABU5RJV5_9PSEU|nr:hypothetical protein [Amycolatopsis sp., V23-08]MEA5366468.1 hypothetical protein [Amycolatopsis sp., V23-08]
MAGAIEAIAGAAWLSLRRWSARGVRRYRVTAVRPLPAVFRVSPVAGTVVDDVSGVERELLRTTVPVLVDDVVRCGPAGGGRVRLLPTPRTALPAAFAVRGVLLVAFGLAAGRLGLGPDVTASYLFVAWMFTLFGALSAGIAAGRLRFAALAREIEGDVVDERRWLNRAPSEPKVRYTVYGRTRSAWAGRYTFVSPRVGKTVAVLLDPRAEASVRRVGGSFGIYQFLGALAGLLGVLQFLNALG